MAHRINLAKNSFEDKLKILHEVGNELSLTSSVYELCRRAVELGRNRLGFDRLSTWFVDQDAKSITGSFGVDEKGRLREEAGERVPIDSDPIVREIRADKAHSILRTGVPLRDNSGKVVGEGSHIVAAIWNGKEVIGYVSTDNLLKHARLTEGDRELVERFASTFGHLYSLKRTEEALQAAYNRLKEIQDQLIQAAKMEVVGGLASGVAHEVKNPLAVILQGIEYLSKKVGPKDEKSHAALLRMRIAVTKADAIIKGLLDFSSAAEVDLAPQDLNIVIEESLFLITYELNRYHIEIIKDLKKGIPKVRIDRNRIEQVLLNIFLNAVNHMPKGGRLTIKTYSAAAGKNKKEVFAEIEDTGPGIPPNIMKKVFDPFFTTRRGIGGTGLGLTIAKNIVEMHKGTITIENRKGGRGTRVTLMFGA